MILIVNSNNHPRLEEVYALRARILHDRWGWKVNVIGGKEMDELDDVPPTHMLYIVNDELLGYMRLLPTTGPTVLTRYFSDVFKDHPIAPDILEVSKFCLADSILDQVYFTKAYHSAVMFAALGKFCWRNNVNTVTGVIDERTLGFYSKSGIVVNVLEEATIDGAKCFNITRSMSRSWLQKTAEWFGDRILEESELAKG